MHFHLPLSESPTYDNLARHLKELRWIPTRFLWRARFSKNNFQFSAASTEQLEYKHLLNQLVQQYCPHVMPLTYGINDENWQWIYKKIRTQSDHSETLSPWILKPALLNNGQHIHIFKNMDDLERHYSQTKRMGGEHVLQHYITPPHLLKGPSLGHKYSIRMFIILTNYAGNYLYPNGYFNVALNPYLFDDFSNLRPHLTNEHLHENEINVIQVPTQQYDIFGLLYPQIKHIVSDVLNGLQRQHPDAFVCTQDRTLAIFGFDFVVDNHIRAWLIEANHFPCFPTSDEHPLQKKLYHPFWKALIADFIHPIAIHQSVDSIQPSSFERIL